MLEGFISKIVSGRYEVNVNDTIYPCRARGLFRLQDITPVVGDEVIFDEKELYLNEIKPRKNHFLRPLIANVDQVLIVASAKEPVISVSHILRYITLSIIANVNPVIIISKIDLDNKKNYLETKKELETKGYQVILYSKETKEGLNDIKEVLKNKKSVFTGQSGVGKSSLINELLGEQIQQTSNISYSRGRGKHCTRVVELIKYQDGYIGDSPGFSSIDFDIDPIFLANNYPGFSIGKCKFRNCLHDKEIGCFIKEEVSKGNISTTYYENYLSILHELQKKERY
ncbi:MAG: ribosome small subunit-dependent GTPase A [Bacilli bacterium]|nr:ribosome small subunit-dependent GTPase A [Bacilli bacterium]